MYEPDLNCQAMIERIRKYFGNDQCCCHFCSKELYDDDCKECVWWAKPGEFSKWFNGGGRLKLIERLKERIEKEVDAGDAN
ncbi:MAG: hypothetical protein ACTSSK_03620 [Candidatus Heimdallarchaeota archaeon]